MQLSVGIESINSYKRLSYNVWFALAEFVDNSTQSYRDNKALLDAAYENENTRLTISILYDPDTRTLTIRDNSIGMSQTELEAALLIAANPPREGGRSKYGMGLKTAACWFGDEWTIKTKKLGEKESVRVTVDVPAVAERRTGLLAPDIHPAEESAHYTEIKIGKLHRRFSTATKNNTRKHLASIYRRDLKEGATEIWFQNELVKWESFGSKSFLNDKEGNQYLKNVSIDVNGKTVTGWVGVLASGGRTFGGFSLLQNDRVIRGYPTAWKPAAIFGQEEGSNDTVNQRLCGELNVDGFQVNHTKEDISWQDDEQEILEEKLAEECKTFRQVARTPYKGDTRRPTEKDIDEAVSQLEQELGSNAAIDTIELVEAPPETVLETSSKLVMAEVAKKPPRMDIQVGSLRVKLYFDHEARPDSAYYHMEMLAEERTVSVSINHQHPYLITIGAAGYPDYVRQCVYDAIAEFIAAKMTGKVEAHTVRFHKDNLLRTPYKIHDEANESEADSPSEPDLFSQV
ncbi:MAG: ATP-binding protein [Glaciimonas sp.]|nr:ATP-binding protein [Glaciimonas sp.]